MRLGPRINRMPTQSRGHGSRPKTGNRWYGGLKASTRNGHLATNGSRPSRRFISSFQQGHNLLHLPRIIEHPPGGAQAFLPVDAKEVGGGIGEFAAHAVEFGLLRVAQLELV